MSVELEPVIRRSSAELLSYHTEVFRVYLSVISRCQYCPSLLHRHIKPSYVECLILSNYRHVDTHIL